MQRNTDACNNSDESHRPYANELRLTQKDNYIIILCIRNSKTCKTAYINRNQVCLILEGGVAEGTDSK